MPDNPIVVTNGQGQLITQLEGTKTKAPCNLCEDQTFPRLSAADGTLMQRYWLDPCGSGPAEPMGFRRVPLCCASCYPACTGSPATVQTYEITNNCEAQPEVWTALSVFETFAYPYQALLTPACYGSLYGVQLVNIIAPQYMARIARVLYCGACC